MAGGRRPRCLSPACLFLAAAVALLAMPGLAAARTRRYTFNVRTHAPSIRRPMRVSSFSQATGGNS